MAHQPSTSAIGNIFLRLFEEIQNTISEERDIKITINYTQDAKKTNPRFVLELSTEQITSPPQEPVVKKDKPSNEHGTEKTISHTNEAIPKKHVTTPNEPQPWIENELGNTYTKPYSFFEWYHLNNGQNEELYRNFECINCQQMNSTKNASDTSGNGFKSREQDKRSNAQLLFDKQVELAQHKLEQKMARLKRPNNG